MIGNLKYNGAVTDINLNIKILWEKNLMRNFFLLNKPIQI